MKILLSANNYPTPDYPLQAFIGVIAHELTRQGHEVTVVAPVSILSYIKHGIKLPPFKYFDSVLTEEGEKRIYIYRPRVLVPGEGRFIKISSWLTQQIVNRCIKRINNTFDVLYAHFWSSALNMLSYANHVKTPLFVASGEDKIGTKYLRSEANIKNLFERTSGVICVSTKNKEESINLLLTSSDKSIVLPNAVDTKDFKCIDRIYARNYLGFPHDAFIIAFCGRFIERKGVMRLSEAIDRCGDSNIKSIFIGRPIEGSKMTPNCNGILFQGTLPHDKVALYLSAADVYVLPTQAEGCSNSIVEAMACGLPIISSDLPFNHDILDSSNAVLIDPNDIDEIKEAILRLKNDVIFRNQLASGSLNKAKELTIEKRVERIVNFIEIKIHENI